MNNLLGSLVLVTLCFSSLIASPNAGQEILEKKLNSGCTVTIADLAAKHTQKEWEKLKDSKKLRAELKKLEPNLLDINDKELLDVFDFLYEYGSDSGLFPSCGS